jgi:hypothetical protein
MIDRFVNSLMVFDASQVAFIILVLTPARFRAGFTPRTAVNPSPAQPCRNGDG